jgi:hypothetical protein
MDKGDVSAERFFRQLHENGRRWADELALASRAGIPKWALKPLTRAFESQVKRACGYYPLHVM